MLPPFSTKIENCTMSLKLKVSHSFLKQNAFEIRLRITVKSMGQKNTTPYDHFPHL